MSRGVHFSVPERVTLRGWKVEQPVAFGLGILLDGAAPALLDGFDASFLRGVTTFLIVVDGAPVGFRSEFVDHYNGALFATTSRHLRRLLAELGHPPPSLESTDQLDAWFASGLDPARSALTMSLSESGRRIFDRLTAHELLALRRRGILLPEPPARPA